MFVEGSREENELVRLEMKRAAISRLSLAQKDLQIVVTLLMEETQ